MDRAPALAFSVRNIWGFLAVLGQNLLAQKKYAEAEELLHDCLKIQEKHQPEVWSTFNTRSMLGGAMLGLKKNSETEPLLLTGYEGLKKQEAQIPIENKAHLIESLDRLVQLYESKGHREKAAEWRTRREQQKDSPKP